MPTSSQRPAINPALSYGLNFDSHDLQANQNGTMTPRQVRLLRDKRRLPHPSPTLLGRVYGGIFYLVYGVTPRMHDWNLIGADITATSATHRQGMVRLPPPTSVKDKARRIYQINVDHRACKVDRRALRSFVHGQSYTVYYAPRSKHALSAE